MSVFRRGGIDSVPLISGGGANPEALSGVIDPTTGGGVAAPEGSIYLQYTAAAGESWLKYAAGNTDWRRFGGKLDEIKTGADIGSIMSCNAPDGAWKGNNASGAIDITGGGNNLVDVNGPTKGYVDPLFRVNSTFFNIYTLQSMDAANAAVMDLGSQSFAMLLVGSGYVGANNRALMGKFDTSAGNRGYRLMGNNSQWIVFSTFDSVGVKIEQIAIDHSVNGGRLVVLAVSDRNANNIQAWSGLGASAGQAAGTGDMSNANLFAIGSFFTSDVCDLAFDMGAMWIGANAEAASGGPTAAGRTALDTYLGG